MPKYVSRCKVEFDGVELSVKNFKEQAREFRKVVSVQYGSGVTDVTPQFLFSVDVPVATTGERAWEAFVDGTVTAALDGGQRITFEQVSTLSVGELTIDGENESVRTIEFHAARRKVE
jgi:hypothetical protein